MAGRFHKRPLQGNVKLLILLTNFQCACLRMPRSTTKHVQRDVFVWRKCSCLLPSDTDRQTDRPVFCLSPFQNRTSILHFTVKRFLLSCPQFDRLNLGDRPTTSLHCTSENTPRHVSTKRHSKNRPNVSCPAAGFPP